MKNYLKNIMTALAVIFFYSTLAALGPGNVVGGSKLAPGEVEILYTFPDPGVDLWTSTEGVACDRNGNLMVSMRSVNTLSGETYENMIIRISPAGEEEVLVDLGTSGEKAGLLGLTTDPQGNVYTALISEFGNHGVWKVDPAGNAEKLAGSQSIAVPNALTFDARGNLYVSDCYIGLIWKYGRNTQEFSVWSDDPLLAPYPTDPYGFVLPGVNGLAFAPPDRLYSANTEKSEVSCIPILPDGSAGTGTLIASGGLLLNPDDISVDTEGNVYTVHPIAGAVAVAGDDYPPLSPVVKTYVDTGVVVPVVMPYKLGHPLQQAFDMPTSLCVGGGPLDNKSVFVVSQGIRNFGMPFGAGPRLTQVGTGVPGRAGQ